MTNEEKILNLLGLAKRAGKLSTGEALVIDEIRKQKAKLVFIASDASENTRKKVSDKSSTYKVPYLNRFTHEQLSHAIGQNRKVIAVMDNGFAKRIKELSKILEGEFIEQKENL